MTSGSDYVHLLGGAYVVDALDHDERADFEGHLAWCDECTAEVGGLSAAAARLGATAAVSPPASMKVAVLARIADTPQLGPEPSGARQARPATVVPFRRRAAVWVLGAAAAVLAVAAVSLGVLFANAQSDRDSAVAQAQSVTAVLSAPDAKTLSGQVAGAGTATLVVSDSEQSSVLVSRSMPEPPSGKVYQLWYIDAAGHATSAGTFTPKASGAVAEPLQGTPVGAAVVGMTVEPSGGSAQPTSKPILAIPLTA